MRLDGPRGALRFYADLQECGSVAECADLFRGAIAPYAIEAFACGEIDLADRDRNVLFIAEWPPAWKQYYLRSGFIKRDPILNAVWIYRKPFTFDDIVHDPRFSTFDREAIRAAAEHGWRRGMAVPVARGGSRFGLVTMIGRGQGLDEPGRAYLGLISECLLTRVGSLGPLAEYAMPPAGMSKREIEVARLVAQGLSDPEIAVELGISASTAHHHVEGARKRLNAKNRAHMAALSVSLAIASATEAS